MHGQGNNPKLLILISMLVVATCSAGITNADPASGSDWPAWSGPNGDLTVDGAAVFKAGVGLESSWKRTLGSGY